MHRSRPANAPATAPRLRLARVLACAAVPVMLVAAGCSSDSGGDKKKESGASSSASAPSGGTSSAPAPAPAKFAKLPDPCKALSQKTIENLVPKAKSKSGTAGKSSDVSSQGTCSWNGLDDKGVKGSQYRWLDVSFKRYPSDAAIGSGDQRAAKEYARLVTTSKSADGAKNVKTTAVSGIGDEATAIGYDLNKTDEDFKYAVIVARTANAVVLLDYNGAGYQGADAPDAGDLMKDAQAAAKEAVASVASANGGQ
ncbi:DUF3558 family protein [Streptomyces sp. NPDC059070]|uniref:DUF3558 family protein n=1 Tax=Streptomyces sp. NPDC059070 TaxID=3346713 RepID=UPI00368372D5